MDISIVTSEIEYWDNYIASLDERDKILELAFFKIYVKFESFLSTAFINYCIGGASLSGNIPQRKLCFVDREHLDNVLKSRGGSYIDYLSMIENVSDHIFINNPFYPLKASTYADDLTKMKILRNFIAHESVISKERYIKNVLSNQPYIEPYEHLKKIKKKSSDTYYTHYISILKDVSELLVDPLESWD